MDKKEIQNFIDSLTDEEVIVFKAMINNLIKQLDNETTNS